MGYELRGQLAEVCTCHTFCPCAAGLPPDGGVCEFNWVFHFDAGAIGGVDVAGLNVGLLARLTGNAVDGGTVKAAVFVDDQASGEQQDALLAAFTGKEGGPLADLAGLVTEVVAVERMPIHFDVAAGSGRFGVGRVFDAEVGAIRGPDGNPTRLENHVLAGVLGSTAYPGRVASHSLDAADYGFDFTVNSSTTFEFHYLAA